MAAFVVDLQVIFIFILVWLFSAFFLFKKPRKSNVRLPPSPPALPVIGHLHLLLSIPWFKSFQKLSSKYGPFLHLRLCNTSIVLVSSASVANEIFKTQDVNFSDRNHGVTENSLLFSDSGFLLAPYGAYWKFMKKVAISELLGRQYLERTREIRGEELDRFYVTLLEKAKRGEPFDVVNEMTKLSSNGLSRMLMGRKMSEENGEAEQVKDLVVKSFGLMRKLFLAYGLRPLKKIGISFFEREIREVSQKFDELLEKILREHEENPNREQKDTMDLLLEAYHDENAQYKISRDQMKSFLADILIGGIDSSARSTEWIMAELINHPNILKKVRDEIESVVGKDRKLRESDVSSLPYLQAVVKEGLRLHPPGLLVFRKCREWCKIRGFDVPENTPVVINNYGIMRDPNSWENPDEFRPERFFGSSAEENREQSFKFLVFGGGRRACPGEKLAYLSIGAAVGTMAHYFDWKIDGEKVNVEESGGMDLAMAHPLMSVPVVRFTPSASV
ncbi:PREDICTED: cytochrome P450 705A5-like [Tarenaya hassleriana]|uniref:cytochrome P450 705A5-like n=1 Tax=Tarenaya hassleriana TaxID=28532 RepID=UPI00053C0985|nr:PREDICTED: cytochrome P450 705A5-like [Tarenaya hassleriana]